jgi:four helix bundle protein
MPEKQFRFQELEIWKKAARMTRDLLSLADGLQQHKHFRFTEQLRAATLSITNNIAEGSGSQSKADFANFLNVARRSVFETANILMILSQYGYLPGEDVPRLLNELAEESRIILGFIRTLRS